MQLRYFRRRLTYAALSIVLVAVTNFLLVHLAPGNAADVLAGEAGAATPEYMAQLRTELGLDQPLYIQFLVYVERLLTFRLGYSFRYGESVSTLILSRAGPTMLLMGAAITLAVGFGVLLGALAAVSPNTLRDYLISVFAVVFYATPSFLIALMLILVFSIKLGWFPPNGMRTLLASHSGWRHILDIAHHLVLPALTYSLFYLALYVRLTRASMLQQIAMDHVRTARAKGLPEWSVISKHALRSAVLPIATMLGIQMGGLMGGSVIVETVFGWPGLGSLTFDAVFARELNVLLGIFYLSSFLVVSVNLVVDFVYSFLDPRVQFG